MEWINLIQWPAMAFTVTAAWNSGSQNQAKRMIGFWLFIFGNILWLIWGLHDKAWALIVLQLFLAGINIRGAKKNTSEESKNEVKKMVKQG